MTNKLTDDQLRDKALNVLTQHLGPSQTFRFLSWMRTKPGDYQRWRDGRFNGLSADELIGRMRQAESRSEVDGSAG